MEIREVCEYIQKFKSLMFSTLIFKNCLDKKIHSPAPLSPFLDCHFHFKFQRCQCSSMSSRIAKVYFLRLVHLKVCILLVFSLESIAQSLVSKTNSTDS